MSPSRRVAYQFFTQTVWLLVIYGLTAFTADHLRVGASTLLQWVAVGGLLGGGIYITASAQPDDHLPHESLLHFTARWWWLWVGLALLDAVFDPPDFALSITLLQSAIIICVILSMARAPVQTRIIRVWLIGMGLVILNQLFLPQSFIAYLLPALALGYWLIRRFSDVSQLWVDTSLYTVATLLTLAGILQLVLPTLPTFLGIPGAVISSIFYLIYAAHSYKPLSTRNATHTLAAHWFALAVLLVIFGLAFLGAVLAVPDVHRWTHTTYLTDAQHSFTSFAVIALILGTINQAGAELRGHNWRITGLMPFWLIAFGSIGSGLLLAAAGLVQVYLERVFSLPPAEVDALLQPLFILHMIFVASTALGFLIYALGFRARRPVVESRQV